MDSFNLEILIGSTIDGSPKRKETIDGDFKSARTSWLRGIAYDDENHQTYFQDGDSLRVINHHLESVSRLFNLHSSIVSIALVPKPHRTDNLFMLICASDSIHVMSRAGVVRILPCCWWWHNTTVLIGESDVHFSDLCDGQFDCGVSPGDHQQQQQQQPPKFIVTDADINSNHPVYEVDITTGVTSCLRSGTKHPYASILESNSSVTVLPQLDTLLTTTTSAITCANISCFNSNCSSISCAMRHETLLFVAVRTELMIFYMDELLGIWSKKTALILPSEIAGMTFCSPPGVSQHRAEQILTTCARIEPFDKWPPGITNIIARLAAPTENCLLVTNQGTNRICRVPLPLEYRY